MTTLEALDDMIQAVRAGETSRVHIERMSGKAGLAEAGSIYGAAYQDDLNAARMIHNALVPGYDLLLDLNSDVSVSNNGKTLFTYRDFFAKADGKPGRAWLLAALQAYRSTLVAS